MSYLHTFYNSFSRSDLYLSVHIGFFQVSNFMPGAGFEPPHNRLQDKRLNHWAISATTSDCSYYLLYCRTRGVYTAKILFCMNYRLVLHKQTHYLINMKAF